MLASQTDRLEKRSVLGVCVCVREKESIQNCICTHKHIASCMRRERQREREREKQSVNLFPARKSTLASAEEMKKLKSTDTDEKENQRGEQNEKILH